MKDVPAVANMQTIGDREAKPHKPAKRPIVAPMPSAAGVVRPKWQRQTQALKKAVDDRVRMIEKDKKQSNRQKQQQLSGKEFKLAQKGFNAHQGDNGVGEKPNGDVLFGGNSNYTTGS